MERVFTPAIGCCFTKRRWHLTQARKTFVLLPYIIEQLQGADSGARAAALLVLRSVLQLLEGKMLSLTALALAEKLQPLFNDVRLG